MASGIGEVHPNIQEVVPGLSFLGLKMETLGHKIGDECLHFRRLNLSIHIGG